MDTRRSFYLAPRQDDFVEPVSDANWVDSTDVPYVTPATDTCGSKIDYRPAVGACFVVYLPCIASVGRTRL
jgi:hypothetical protein